MGINNKRLTPILKYFLKKFCKFRVCLTKKKYGCSKCLKTWEMYYDACSCNKKKGGIGTFLFIASIVFILVLLDFNIILIALCMIGGLILNNIWS